MVNPNGYHFSDTEYYSTLQVVPQPQKTPAWIDGSFDEKESLQVWPESTLEPVKAQLFSDPSDAPELSPYNSPLASSIAPDASLTRSFGTLITEKKGGAWKGGRTICGIPRKTFWILLGVKLLMMVLVIAVPVGLFVRRGKHTSAHANASNVPPSSPIMISNTSSLASIAWNDTNGIMQYRVYWQGEDNIIRESAWNATANLWQLSNSAIGIAKANSPLAAVVSGPAVYPFQIHLGAISASDTIVFWLCTDPELVDGETDFTSGPFIDPTNAPAAHTALAATWDRALDCNGCSETLLLLYQDTAGQLALGNLTVDGWLWSTLFANPVPGTGLALDVRSMGSITRNIAIFYQLGNDYLTATLFNGTTYQWETRESDPIAMIAANASIASSNYGSTSVGVTLDEVVLSTSSNGTAVNIWDGQTQTFGTGEYSTVLGESRSLATNADAHAYGLQHGTVKEFKFDNMLAWSVVGNVTTS